ncbi:MAG: Hsp70 family protein [Vibrio sp.]
MKYNKNARYLVGIDLGTTNSVMAYSEIQDDLSQSPVHIFEIDQLIGPGEVARRPLLPSFRFHPGDNQFSPQDTQLPWQHTHLESDEPNVIVGVWARELGAQIEGRQVASAKSWLSHHGVDRSAEILPWGGRDDILKVSPVLASASYLYHMHQSWNSHHSDAPLAEQDVVITIPASFDETARQYTLDAAKLAGLPNNVILLEEPQAVCYDWYHRNQDDAAQKLKDIEQILICDVGGGTTDLSLIAATQDKEQALQLSRIGVGDHLMLGGDNIDLTLAHYAEQQLNRNQPMKAQALMKLINQTRRVKEDLLHPNAPEQAKISVLGSGSRLIGGTQSATIEKDTLHKTVLDGFFPLSSLDTLPSERQKAVVEFGLPYAQDPAISHHLAQFLTQHNASSAQKVPAAILLNGGIFNSELIEQRVKTLLESWRGDAITVLENPNPDLAVAFGAVAYAKARRGAQLKIGGGSARSYFLHLKQKNKSQALCVLSKGTEENHEIRLTGREFLLTLGEPVKIDILTSTQDSFINAQNALVPAQNSLLLEVKSNLEQAQFKPLPPYIATLDGSQTQLHANQKERVRVMLACQLTEVGTLKLECIGIEDESQRWELEFDARREQDFEQKEALHPNLQAAQDIIATTFSANRRSDQAKQIKVLAKDLEKLLGKRENWDYALSRELFDSFALGRKRRRRSSDHEKQWLRLSGFALRPGFGDAADSWRIEQIWPIYQQGLQFPSHQTWSDWWTFWRRISGGLNQEQQETILADIAKYLHPGAMRQKGSAKAANERGYEAMVRLAASLEHLDVEDKALLVNWFISRAQKQTEFVQAHWWAVARLAARTQMYASAHNVINKATVESWLTQMLSLDWKAEPMIGFAAMMMSRKTGDRILDIDESMRNQVIDKLEQARSPASWVRLVSEIADLSEQESKRLFGDSLPTGLSLV